MGNNKATLNISGSLVLLAVLVLFVLRAAEVISCSWWLVFAPLLIGPAILLFWVLFMLLWVVVVALIDTYAK